MLCFPSTKICPVDVNVNEILIVKFWRQFSGDIRVAAETLNVGGKPEMWEGVRNIISLHSLHPILQLILAFSLNCK